ncbi:MAG: Gldg family protein [Clostridia bacterium]|nr:Gldg family protein [Clostridia bacterium]
MKHRFSTGHASRWVTTLVTCLVVVGILLCNIGVTALFGKFLVQSDLTSLNYRSTAGGRGIWVKTGLYSLVDETVNLLSSVLESAHTEDGAPAKVEILFCADEDLLVANDEMRPIYYTARLLEREFPKSISVRTVDVWNNPSSVDDYRTTSYSAIYQTSVIISSGSEFRIRSPRVFYTYDSVEETTPWAYNGEKIFVKDILAVTRTESPICCLTTNHGEPVANAKESGEYSELITVLQNAGYRVQYLDLSAEEIPEDCRLIVTLGPTADFSNDPKNPGASEIKKLDAFLEKTYAFLIFADADTPYLPNLEEYLEEWGISFGRTEDLDGIYQAVDPENDLGKSGERFSAIYSEAGRGASLLSDLRKIGGHPKAVFENAATISYSPTYEVTYVMEDAESGTPAYSYGAYFSNGNSREICNLFYTGNNATALAKEDGKAVLDDKGNLVTKTDAPFCVATLSTESRTVSEGQGMTNVNEASYVCAIASTAFAKNDALSTNAYGNTDILLQILRGIGQEILPVGLNFKTLPVEEFGTDSETGASYGQILLFGPNGQTAILTLVPGLTCLILGCVLLAKRKKHA